MDSSAMPAETCSFERPNNGRPWKRSLLRAVMDAVWMGAAKLEWLTLKPNSPARMDPARIVENYGDLQKHFAAATVAWPDAQEIIGPGDRCGGKVLLQITVVLDDASRIHAGRRVRLEREPFELRGSHPDSVHHRTQQGPFPGSPIVWPLERTCLRRHRR